MVRVLGLYEVGSVELLVFCAVTALHTAVVALATEGIAPQVSSEGLEVAGGQAGGLRWVVPTELLAPVGLEGDLGLQVMGTTGEARSNGAW